ncbi:MAG: patatin-like phospholipase family protein, partial [Rhodobacteraceae bacterium]|nr:patatin-like phospholipase family protein [Paracoccaceae bacterium]
MRPVDKDEELERIGIALSGGGSRAIAFHLGCLKTLNAYGLIQKSVIMSCVSGGSVIGALYAVHEGSFEEFEDKVHGLLREGLVKPSIKTAFTTNEGIRALVSWLRLIWVILWRVVTKIPKWIVGVFLRGVLSINNDASLPYDLPMRFASRTTLIERTLDRIYFKGATLKDVEKNKVKFVASATELRTGSAFYFSAFESGCWRFGKVNPDNILLAKAVAASAAYPLFLPAMDETFAFNKSDGSERSDRVTLTDGGVYDNLGLSHLWPDRDSRISVRMPKPDTIIACRAGYGLRFGRPSIFLPSRMATSFYTTLDRAQNASIRRLFDLKSAGHLKSVLLPYLGQSDQRLAVIPAGFVRREEVDAYPTNFNAMPAEWIERLSKRGEQVTLAILREHRPDLLGGG